MSGQSGFEGVLRELAQQQSALSQQPTALLQLQTENLRLQRLLIERALGEAGIKQTTSEVATTGAEDVGAEPVLEKPLGGLSMVPVDDADASATASVEPEEARHADESPFGEPAHSNKLVQDAPSVPPLVARSRAARYMQPPNAKPVRPVTRQDVDRVTRLYETGDAAQLVLHFGQYRGATLLQVAAMDPDYIHQLALTAQRPEIRAAARQLVIALEQVAAHKPRAARPAGRRMPTTG
jgi:hypothetical protein